MNNSTMHVKVYSLVSCFPLKRNSRKEPAEISLYLLLDKDQMDSDDSVGMLLFILAEVLLHGGITFFWL